MNSGNPYQSPQPPLPQGGDQYRPPPPPPPPPPSPVYYREPELPDPPNATLIFVLGLLGVLGVCFILGPVAWVMGSAERARVRAGEYRDNGLLTAGYIMGIVSTILLMIPLVLAIFWVLFILILGAGAAISGAGCVI